MLRRCGQRPPQIWMVTFGHCNSRRSSTGLPIPWNGRIGRLPALPSRLESLVRVLEGICIPTEPRPRRRQTRRSQLVVREPILHRSGGWGTNLSDKPRIAMGSLHSLLTLGLYPRHAEALSSAARSVGSIPQFPTAPWRAAGRQDARRDG